MTVTMKMKTTGFALGWLAAAVVLGLASSSTAQDRGTAEVTFGDARVAIDYGRPMLRGRDVETALPPGMLWRMGMNQASTLETAAALTFGGDVELPPGTYSLYLRRVDEKRFNLIVNAQTGQWGTQYDPSQDVASIPLNRTELDENVEEFTITLQQEGKKGQLRLAWGKLSLSATIEPS